MARANDNVVKKGLMLINVGRLEFFIFKSWFSKFYI